MEDKFLMRGNIIYSVKDKQLNVVENGYVVCNKGICEGVFKEIPQKFKDFKIKDFKDALIIPGMIDLHVHAPQYAFRGLGMDLELLDWLNTNAFPEEVKYENLEYAEKAYKIFVEDLKKGTTTRACIFATVHSESTILLMELLEKSNINTYVGKVNMDRNSHKNLCEDSAEISLKHTYKWLEESNRKFKNTKPILTPRFVPSCSDELMKGLGIMQEKYGLPVQSHLSENLSEISWVQELNPKSYCYGDAYDMFGLFGGQSKKAVMAHCVYSTEEEIDLIKNNNVFIAHCPESNLNLSSGIAPIRKYLKKGINLGLGSDIAGGAKLSIMSSMVYAIQSSKIYWRLIDQNQKPLKFEEVFYMATLGGGAFFGKVGTFEKGYEFDAVVLNDNNLKCSKHLSVRERIERCIYDYDKLIVMDKYVAGNKVNLVDNNL